jgi:5-methylcytosine-specific restriction endonuclease McrA
MLKICHKCNTQKPVDVFSCDVRYHDGYYPWCMDCRLDYQRAYRQKQRDSRPKKQPSDTKKCTKCGTEKPLADYSKTKNGLHGRKSFCKACDHVKYLAYSDRHKELAQAHYAAHRDEILEQQRRYREANPEQMADRRHRYYRENKNRIFESRQLAHIQNPERTKQWKQNEYLRHRDRYALSRKKWQQLNPDKAREKTRAWFRRNRLKRRMYQHRRRARQLLAGGAFTADQWQQMIVWFGNSCLCCGASDALTIDHVIPIVDGGKNDIRNLQPLCPSCNSRKGASTVDYRDPAKLAAFLDRFGW